MGSKCRDTQSSGSIGMCCLTPGSGGLIGTREPLSKYRVALSLELQLLLHVGLPFPNASRWPPAYSPASAPSGRAGSHARSPFLSPPPWRAFLGADSLVVSPPHCRFSSLEDPRQLLLGPIEQMRITSQWALSISVAHSPEIPFSFSSPGEEAYAATQALQSMGSLLAILPQTPSPGALRAHPWGLLQLFHTLRHACPGQAK